MMVEEFNHDCIIDYELQGESVLPEFYKGAGELAISAAAGIRDLEHDYFEIRSGCINHSSRGKLATLAVRYMVLDSSGWSRTKLLDATRQANAVLGQCGIHFDNIGVNVIAVDDRYNSVDAVEFVQLINSTRYSLDATLYFMNDQTVEDRKLWGLAFAEGYSAWYEYYPEELRSYADTETLARPGILDNLALIIGNHTSKRQSEYRWRTLGLGRTIAHELYHILGACRCHEKSDETNFMYPGGGYKSITVTAEQCRKARIGVSRLRSNENTRIMTFEEP